MLEIVFQECHEGALPHLVEGPILLAIRFESFVSQGNPGTVVCFFKFDGDLRWVHMAPVLVRFERGMSWKLDYLPGEHQPIVRRDF
jgi:hypothetical protein